MLVVPHHAQGKRAGIPHLQTPQRRCSPIPRRHPYPRLQTHRQGQLHRRTSHTIQSRRKRRHILPRRRSSQCHPILCDRQRTPLPPRRCLFQRSPQCRLPCPRARLHPRRHRKDAQDAGVEVREKLQSYKLQSYKLQSYKLQSYKLQSYRDSEVQRCRVVLLLFRSNHAKLRNSITL